MAPKLPLPRGWKCRVRSSILHILALSHFAFTALLARAAQSKNRQVRLRAQIDRRDREIALLQEELRIKNARMERVPPHRLRRSCSARRTISPQHETHRTTSRFVSPPPNPYRTPGFGEYFV